MTDRTISRRGALAGLIGSAAAVSAAKGASAGAPPASVPLSPAAANVCRMTPRMVEGPFYFDPALVREDITDLVRHFVQMTEKEGMAPKRFDNEALDVMKAYPWPGNVRELENFVRRLTALYPQDVITREIAESELKPDIAASPVDKGALRSGPVSISQAVEENMRSYFAEFGEALPPAGLYDRVLAEMEYPLILAALTATRGNQIKAAELLGLNRNTLRKKIRELEIHVMRRSV